MKILKGRIKEKDDDLLICDPTLKNKDSEIKKLKN
jgi:hypothetical protein